MEKNKQHKQVILEIKKLTSLLNEVQITDISSLSKYPRKNEPLDSNKNFIIHHTAGRGSAESVVNVLNNRKNKKTGKVQPLGVHYVIDREGKVFRTLPSGGRGAHILDSDDFAKAPKGINNSNSQGVEVIGMNDEDILPVQAAAALQLVKQLGFSPDQIFGHGTINPGHKSPTEGMTIKKFIDRNYDNDEDDYDYSDFPESKRPEPGWMNMSQSEIDKGIEKIFGDYGVENISKISSQSDCEDYVKKIENALGKDVLEYKDNPCEILWFGYPISDYIEIAKETEKEWENEKKKLEDEKKKKEEEEKEKEEEKKKEEEKESKLTEELKQFKRFLK